MEAVPWVKVKRWDNFFDEIKWRDVRLNQRRKFSLAQGMLLALVTSIIDMVPGIRSVSAMRMLVRSNTPEFDALHCRWCRRNPMSGLLRWRCLLLLLLLLLL